MPCFVCLSSCSCVFDLPFFFCRGADRMRVLTNLLSFAFDKVEARPRAVNLQLINQQVNRSTVFVAADTKRSNLTRCLRAQGLALGAVVHCT